MNALSADLGPLGHPDHLRVSWLGRRDDRVSPRRPSPGNRCFLSARGGAILSGHEVPFHVAATRFWESEGEAYDRALSMVVAAQAALPMAAFLGHGAERLQRWPVLPGRRPGEAPQPGQRPGTGTEPGVKAYSHVSDRFSPFATQTIPPPSTKPLHPRTGS